MTLESYSTLATKNYNFYAPWNRICGHLVFVLSAILCLSICGKKLTLEPTSYLAPTTYSNNDYETVSITC